MDNENVPSQGVGDDLSDNLSSITQTVLRHYEAAGADGAHLANQINHPSVSVAGIRVIRDSRTITVSPAHPLSWPAAKFASSRAIRLGQSSRAFLEGMNRQTAAAFGDDP